MHVLSALPRQRTTLAVETVGYLVPRLGFTGCVDSVFARACNLAVDGTLLTLCAARTGIGPLALHLARGAAPDLRSYFEVGERIDGGQSRLQTRRVELHWAQAEVWRPAALPALLAREQIDVHVQAAAARLAQWRQTQPNILDGAGAAVAAALCDACRMLDAGRAAPQVQRLIGWGEGLTPAGDDYLVGLFAGLDALVQRDPRRLRFRAALAATVISVAQRTTALSAHYLRLAARGHFGAPLISLRAALLADPGEHVVDAALQTALAIGATSGADTASGLLAALAAWPVPA